MFSVIIPVYNKAHHLKRCINSILEQQLNPFEIIIIDDASADGSSEIINKYTDPRIRLFTRDIPGPGGYAARNLGILNTTRKWLVFLDADDEWLPNHLKIFEALIADHPQTNFFASSWIKSYGKKRPKIANRYSAMITKPTLLTLKDFLRLGVHGITPMHTNTICVEKNTIIEAGMFPAGKCKRSGDVDTWLRIVAHTDHVIVTPQTTAIYHLDSQNRITGNPNNIAGNHPSVYTVQGLLNNSTDPSLKRYLKAFANTSIVSWMLARKQLDGKRLFGCLKDIYYSRLTLKQMIALVLITALPHKLFKQAMKKAEKIGFRGG